MGLPPVDVCLLTCAVFIVASETASSDGALEGARSLSPAAAAVVDRLSAARLSWRDGLAIDARVRPFALRTVEKEQRMQTGRPQAVVH